MPKNEANQGSSYYYSMNIGSAHFTLINTQLYIGKHMEVEAEVMTNWIKDDLINANLKREDVPWIIVGKHHSLYCNENSHGHINSRNCEVQSDILRKVLEDILYNNTVDLVVQAHLYNYQRQTSIYKDMMITPETDEAHLMMNAKAPVYIVNGNAGNKNGKNHVLPKVPADWVKMSSSDFGFGTLQVNKTTLFWQQYSTEKTRILDYFYLQKR